jgi:hypothetical protein
MLYRDSSANGSKQHCRKLEAKKGLYIDEEKRLERTEGISLLLKNLRCNSPASDDQTSEVEAAKATREGPIERHDSRVGK